MWKPCAFVSFAMSLMPVGVTAVSMKYNMSLSDVLANKGFVFWSAPVVGVSFYLGISIVRMRKVATRHTVTASVFLFWMLVNWLRAGVRGIDPGTCLLIMAAYLYGLLVYARYRARAVTTARP